MFRVGSNRKLHEYGIETTNTPKPAEEAKSNSSKCPHGGVRLSPKRFVYPFGIIPEAVQRTQDAKKNAAQEAKAVVSEESSISPPKMF